MKTGLAECFPIEKSNLFNLYLLEKEEIDKLKWCLSEKAGRDVGIEFARWYWIWNHRERWLQSINTGQQQQ